MHSSTGIDGSAAAVAPAGGAPRCGVAIGDQVLDAEGGPVGLVADVGGAVGAPAEGGWQQEVHGEQQGAARGRRTAMRWPPSTTWLAVLPPGLATGLGGGGHLHDDTPYTVTGVLKPCGCVLDRLVLTATESV